MQVINFMQVMLVRLMSKGEYLIVPKGTKFTGSGKLGLTENVLYYKNVHNLHITGSMYQITCIIVCTSHTTLSIVMFII